MLNTDTIGFKVGKFCSKGGGRLSYFSSRSTELVDISEVLTQGKKITNEIARVLVREPGCTAREIARRLRNVDLNVDRSGVNSILYSERSLFWNWRDGSGPPHWYLVSGSPIPSASGALELFPEPRVQVAPTIPITPFALYAWQAEALDAWGKDGHQGVIEAVTGSGKTRVGLAAAWEKLRTGGKVQVLVPTVELLHQWEAWVREYFPTYRLGLLGDGYKNSLSRVDILIAVVNSARDRDPWDVDDALLIADECHRYGTDRNSDALNTEAFMDRLGLSATYARNDDGNEEWLDPFFGGTCFQLNYDRAISDEVMAHFKVALVGVDFSREERTEYEGLDFTVRNLMAKLINEANVTPEPFGTFMAEVNALKEGGYGAATLWARQYLSAFGKRRQLLADTSAKGELLLVLEEAVRRAERVLVFTEQKAAAEEAADILLSRGIRAGAIHSGLQRELRKNLLRQFAEGSVRVICAPRVLDEGVDVPAADLGIILAASRTRRQMIQRMGRVLRRKSDGRLARFVIGYVRGTSEDPKFGAHETFLEDITTVADDVKYFDAAREATTLCAYLNDFAWSGPIPSPRMAQHS